MAQESIEDFGAEIEDLIGSVQVELLNFEEEASLIRKIKERTSQVYQEMEKIEQFKREESASRCA